MEQGIGFLALAVAFFVGIHAVPAIGSVRAAAVGAMGENAFRGVFSLVSAAGMVWVVWAYIQAPVLDNVLWTGRHGAKHTALWMMAISFILFVCSLTSPNPTIAGAEKLLKKDEPAKGIIRVTRHPLMWSFGLWGIAHLVNRTDPASLLLFGGMAFLALAGTVMLDNKKKRLFPEEWERFSAVTSNIPFAAIVSRRNRLVVSEIGWWRIVLGLAIFVAVALYGHEWAFGSRTIPY